MPLPDQLRNNDPGLVDVTWGPIIFTGVIEGDWGEVESIEDDTTSQAGEDGSVVVSINNDRRGRVTVRLFHTSPTNALLEANRPKPGQQLVTHALTVTDKGQGRKYELSQAWLVRGIPNHTFGANATTREWVFEGTPLNVTATTPAF